MSACGSERGFQMLRDILCGDVWPCNEIVLFNGVYPGRYDRAEACRVEERQVVFDAMSDVSNVVELVSEAM